MTVRSSSGVDCGLLTVCRYLPRRRALFLWSGHVPQALSSSAVILGIVSNRSWEGDRNIQGIALASCRSF